jgi:hypothetical protein
MTDTRRELILARLKTNLDAITGATCYRSRVEPLTRAETPAIILEPVSDQPSEEFPTVLQWQLRVKVTVIVRANTPDDASDVYSQQVHNLIMSDPSVNGYALDIDPDRVEFSLFEADVPLGIISMDFLIRYRSGRTNLTSAS